MRRKIAMDTACDAVFILNNPPIKFITAGSGWIKLITWYKSGRLLSEDIRRPIWYPSFDFISTEEKAKHDRANVQTEHRTKKRFEEASDGEIKSWSTTNTKKSTKYEGISQLPLKLSLSTIMLHLFIFWKPFGLEHYPSIYQPLKRVYLLIVDKSYINFKVCWTSAYFSRESEVFLSCGLINTEKQIWMKMSYWWELGLSVSLISWK